MRSCHHANEWPNDSRPENRSEAEERLPKGVAGVAFIGSGPEDRQEGLTLDPGSPTEAGEVDEERKGLGAPFQLTGNEAVGALQLRVAETSEPEHPKPSCNRNQHRSARSTVEHNTLHADRHGAVAIPAEILPVLEDAVARLVASEDIILGPIKEGSVDMQRFESLWAAFEQART